MSRFVEYCGKLWPREFFDPRLDLLPGACPQCGGLGVVAESIDEERFDVAVPCWMCKMWCKVCHQWVKREGHECQTGGAR
jgi:hypothetical protein